MMGCKANIFIPPCDIVARTTNHVADPVMEIKSLLKPC